MSGHTYAIGDTGPAGGIVFYDKGNTSDGWRYLEAAPANLKVVGGTPTVDSSVVGYDAATISYYFGYYRTTGRNLFVNGTSSYDASNCTVYEIGNGKNNTELLVGAMGAAAHSAETGDSTTANYAAKLCSDVSYGGYDDWYLPTSNELTTIFKSLGNIVNEFYWSSREYSDTTANRQKADPYQSNYDARNYYCRVRPIRRF